MRLFGVSQARLPAKIILSPVSCRNTRMFTPFVSVCQRLPAFASVCQRLPAYGQQSYDARYDNWPFCQYPPLVPPAHHLLQPGSKDRVAHFPPRTRVNETLLRRKNLLPANPRGSTGIFFSQSLRNIHLPEPFLKFLIVQNPYRLNSPP